MAALSLSVTTPSRMGSPMLLPVILRQPARERLGEGLGIRKNHTQIKGPDKEHVDARDGGNVLDLVERLLRLNLNHGQDGVVGLLQIPGKGRHGAEAREGNGRAEAALAHGRELGALDNVAGFSGRAQQRHENLAGSC